MSLRASPRERNEARVRWTSLLDALTLQEAVTSLERRVHMRARGFVVTPNVDHVVRYTRDPAFRAAYNAAALRLADGMPLVWASRLVGRPLTSRVAGADLLPALCEMAAARGYTVFFLGGRPGMAERAAREIAARLPGLQIAGIYTPPDDFRPDGPAAATAVEAVNRARPHILFVGLGSPKQEIWVHSHWDRLAVTVAVCCGAAIDYAAGTRTRAPRWMQRVGLEWLWRLAHEPRRLWRRYLVDDAAFLGILMREWWHLRVRKSNG